MKLATAWHWKCRLHLQCLDFHICAQLRLSEAKVYILSLLLFCCYRAAKCEKQYLEIKISLLPLAYVVAQFTQIKKLCSWDACLLVFSSQIRKHRSQCRKLYCIRRDRRSEAEALSNTCNRSLQAISRFLQFFSFTCWPVGRCSKTEHWTCPTMCGTEGWVLTSVAFNNAWCVGS